MHRGGNDPAGWLTGTNMKSPFRRNRGPRQPDSVAAHESTPPSSQTSASGNEIVVDGICKSFGSHVVLHDICMRINTGELLVIVGESGCGKSVLLDIITGMIDSDAGRILVADHDQPGAPLVNFSALGEAERAHIRRHWGEVFQRNALYGGTVRENIALWFTENTDWPAEQIEERIRHSLAAVNLDVDDVIGKSRQSLSGGMAKRVAIARAIASDPLVMFYDEPTSGLDPVTSTHIQDLIWRTHGQKSPQGIPRTTIIVSHDRELLRRLTPRVIMLHETGVRFDGTFGDFESSTDPIVLRYLARMPALQATWPGSRERRQQADD